MFILLTIVAIIVCVLLGAIVLIQNPKGGGLASNFSSSSQLMGVQRTGDFLEKGTWILAIVLMFISLAMNVSSKAGSGNDSKADQTKANKEASKPSNNGGSATTTTPFGSAQGSTGTPAPSGTTPPPAPKGK
jgi:preprotein translocase subunit SecG